MQFSFRKQLIINGTRLGRRRPNCSRNGARPNGGRIHKPLVHNILCHVQRQPYSVCGHLSEATERRMRRLPILPLRLSVPGADMLRRGREHMSSSPPRKGLHDSSFGIELRVVAEKVFRQFRVVEIGCQRMPCVHAADGVAVLVGELEVVEGKVAGHAFLAG